MCYPVGVVWPFNRGKPGTFRLLRALVRALEGIHTELTALRTLLEHGASDSGSAEQATRAFRTSHPAENRPNLRVVAPQDLEGSLVEYQEAHERLTAALGREPDDEEIIREVERSAS